MRRLEYLPQLDGLRAVAVLAVLLFHGAAGWSSGGFLGVDLFFVVSGYLITALLLGESTATGTVDLRGFYVRRIRRLLPALFGVVTAVVGFAVLYSSAEQAAVVRRDALGAIFYAHNWVQVAADATYFGGFEGPSPLRHLWSLAVEEQFYLAWPLVVLGCRRIAPDPRRLVGVVAAVLFISSAIWMIVLEDRGASIDRLYYGTDTRLQTVAIGALLATTGNRSLRSHRVDRLARRAAPWAFIVVLASFVLVEGDDRWLYRGGFTVFAVCGAVLVGTVVRSGPLSDALSWSPLVAVGRCSYSLYLWHWPIYIAVTPSNTGLDGTPLLATRLALSFLAAGVSFALIEQPLRRRALSPRLAVGLVGSTAALALVAGFAVDDGEEVAGASVVEIALADRAAIPPPTSVATGASASAGPVDGRRVLVVGDSIAYTFSLYVDVEPLGAEFGKVNGGQIGCGLVEAAGTIGTGFVDDPGTCGDRFDIWDRFVVDFDPDVVLVMIGGWEIFDRIVDGTPVETGTQEWRDLIGGHLDTVIESARSGGATVLLATVPCFDADDRGLPGDTAAIRNDHRRVDALNDLLRSRADARRDIALLDVAEVVCPEGEPIDAIDGVELRRDGIHYSPTGATMVWGALMDDLNAVVRR